MLAHKRLGTISFRCPPELAVWLAGYAREQGVSASEFCLRLILDIHRAQHSNGKPGKHPVIADLEEAYQETRKAVADGMIDHYERGRITRPLSRFLDRVWNPRAGVK